MDFKAYINDILTMEDDVFVATNGKILKLDYKGLILKTLDFNADALALLPGGKVAAMDGEKMMLIQANDCRLLNKDIDVAIGSKYIPACTSFTADNCGRIIRGHGGGTKIHVFQMDGKKVAKVKEYSVDMDYRGIHYLS